ncbi:unnamed protein product [Merluccius merluccius]
MSYPLIWTVLSSPETSRTSGFESTSMRSIMRYRGRPTSVSQNRECIRCSQHCLALPVELDQDHVSPSPNASARYFYSFSFSRCSLITVGFAEADGLLSDVCHRFSLCRASPR